MKKLIIPISALFVVGLSYAQTTVPSSTENYIYTKVHLSDPSEQTQKQIETVQYFDGLGRPKQAVNVKASPAGKDVVNYFEYDGFGRQVKDFLPVPQSVTQNGTIYTSPLANATQTDIYGSEKIYAEKILENSPLNRIQQQIQVGTQWAAKPVKFDYEVNTAEDQVRNYQISTTWDAANKMFVSSLQTPQYFQTAKLYKNTVTDEDGNKTIEFKNTRGQILLIRKVISASENADTYYVYNEYNQLAYVMPPLASISGAVDLTTLDNLCYQYRYDSKYKLVEKKIPGKGWEYMVYDKQDRLVLTRDANLEVKGQWLFTKYDQFSRPIYTGIVDSPPGRFQQQNAVDGHGSNNETRSSSNWNNSGIDVFYTNSGAYPTMNFKLLSVNYYDTYPNYSFNPTFPTLILGKPTLTDNVAATGKSTKDLPVMSLVKNIEDDNWTKNYSYYDTKGRAIGSYSINHLGGYTKTESELYFAGVPKQNITRHKRLDTDTERVIVETFEYDHQNRLLVHKHKVDNNPEEILAQNKYNELSQLESKKVGGTNIATPLQTIDYKYNIRGWMTKINDPADLNGKLFGYEIKYTNPAYNSLTAGKYNGNIAEVDWKTSNDGTLRRYDYQYDPLNRLANGIFSEPNSSLPQSSLFDESLEYDLNGNIAKLYRNSKGANGFAQQIDRLTYVYSGNRLTSVTDGSANYKGYPDVSGNNIAYDDNGNMTNQKDKGILKINYNFLNLPNYLEFDKLYYTRGTWQNENVNNFYGADGTKLRKEHRYSDATGYKKKTTDYLNGFQYETIQSQIVTVLKFVPTSEGYFNFENNKYIYQYKDQVGNIRVSFYKDASGNAIVDKESNYYPFGLEHEGYNALAGNPAYKFGFQEQEKQLETGWSSFKWRNYDPTMGRFFNIDPLSEKYAYQSHYNFSENRVVDGRELEGLEAKLINENTIEWRVKIDNKLGFEPSKTLLQDAADVLSQNGLTVKIIEDPKALFTIELALAKTTEDPITRDPITTNGYTINDGNTYDGTTVSKNSPRTLAHELSHKASLPHIFDKTSKVENTKENQKNLMNSGENDKVELRDSRGTNLVPSQTTDMKNHIKITNENRERKEKEQQKLNQTQNGS